MLYILSILTYPQKQKRLDLKCFKLLELVDLIIDNKIVPAINQAEANQLNRQTESAEIMKEYNIQIEAWAPFTEGRNNHEILASLAEKNNRIVAQIVLRWLVQRNIVALSKSTRKDNMAENITILDFKLDTEDIEKNCHSRHRRKPILLASRSEVGESFEQQKAGYINYKSK